MPGTIETVRIVSDVPETGGFIVINAEDFDGEIHTLYVESEEGGLTKAELIADLEDMGVEFDPRAKKADLQALRDEARAIRDA